MRVISKKRLREFWQAYPEAQGPLEAWFKVASKSNWQTFADVRETYPNADMVGEHTVFNIGGNKFRLVVTLRLSYGRLYVRGVMTHKEYDKGNWKKESYVWQIR